ncbi:hypothetical protein SAMN05877831_11123 [Rhodobacter maris]|uniref:Uncharacterized protein n=1 Tax=Rhodobacter maris TaxID=446682 RepID=A0A285SYP2_9RHOB|nr:hypothetical protein SAMN05877831_11123 [Rhodobacter maris]
MRIYAEPKLTAGWVISSATDPHPLRMVWLWQM